jgi:transposase-like protein
MSPRQRPTLQARNVVERLPKPLHAPVRRALRQAWELDDADKAERLLRNLARRLDQEAPGVAASILEGLDEMVTVNRLGLPTPLRRSLACTNSIENMMGTVRRVCRNVKRWRNAAMALRWTAAGMMEAAKGFRRLKATDSSRSSRSRLSLTRASASSRRRLNRKPMPHSITHSDACLAELNRDRGIPSIGMVGRLIPMNSTASASAKHSAGSPPAVNTLAANGKDEPIGQACMSAFTTG